MIHFSFQKLEMEFPKCKESKKQLFDSFIEFPQPGKPCAECISFLSSCYYIIWNWGITDKKCDVKDSRTSLEMKVHYCLIKKINNFQWLLHCNQDTSYYINHVNKNYSRCIVLLAFLRELQSSKLGILHE